MCKIGNRNVKVLKFNTNMFSGVRVELVHKTTIRGTWDYFIVVTDITTGNHIKIEKCNGIQDALRFYKKANGAA